MNLNYLLGVAVGAWVLAGCTSTPTSVNTGAVKAQTFSFVKPPAKPYPAYVDPRQEVHTMIQNAITQNLESRGVKRVESGGDLTVAYLVIVGDNVSTRAISSYFGYGRDTPELHEKAQEAYTGTKSPNHFGAGTLLIDLIDTKTYELLQRHHGTRPLLKDLPTDARAARIQEVVDEILRDVRIGS
jgi:hypothetical protein